MVGTVRQRRSGRRRRNSGPELSKVLQAKNGAKPMRMSHALSCESLQTDHSKEAIILFSLPRSSPESPLSLRSDWSKEIGPLFSNKPETLRYTDCESDGYECTRPSSSVRIHQRQGASPPQRLKNIETVMEQKTELKRECQRHLQDRCESVSEGLEPGLKVQKIQSVYSELFVTDLTDHSEVQLLEDHYRKRKHPGPALRVSDLFRPTQAPPTRLVLTLGVAGVGKTFSVLKFILDWAQGSENQDLDLVLLLSFRELNLVNNGSYSLLQLLKVFHPALHPLTAHTLLQSKVLLVLDGLDESRLCLDFTCEVVSEVTQASEVSSLLVNLIRGNLLPDAQIWITSRPAVAIQIPAWYVHRVTEVRGFFTDEQKETFFRRKFSDAEQLRTVLLHIRSSRSLQVMCQIPVFSWIMATVLDHMLRRTKHGPLPQTLTELYVHFLLVQMQRKKKYDEVSSGPELTRDDCELLLKLGQLALKHLQKGNITFYSEDLEEVDLDPTKAFIQSGLCAVVFRRESVILDRAVYCFVHLSVQEFLAAVYLLHCFSCRNTEELQRFVGEWNKRSALHVLLRKVLEKSLQSPSGHLDLFVRFLHGLCVPPQRHLLGALLGTEDYGKSIDKSMYYLKILDTEWIPLDRSVNIFHCLTEMNNLTVHHEVQDFLRFKDSRKLSGMGYTALGYELQMSEDVLEELNLTEFNCSDKSRSRLLPAVRNCRRAILSDLRLTSAHIAMVTSALSSSPSHLQVLDLSQNRLLDSDLKSLSEALQWPECVLQTLSLRGCGLTDIRPLLAALRSCPSLTQLDLRGNSLQACNMTLLKSASHWLQIMTDSEEKSVRQRERRRRANLRLLLSRFNLNI